MIPKLRVARATNNLKKLTEMYQRGLNLKILDSFENHSDFSGAILGALNSNYHFEFTQEKGQSAPISASHEARPGLI
ncbi:MAG: hypothetical protein Q7U04_12200 [Bacteriovorax sp.]|nr:hypothetical protein [Bacteriovorax sp.]